MKNKVGHWLTVLGLLFVLAAAALWSYNYADANRADEAAQSLLTEVTVQQQGGIVSKTAETATPESTDSEMFLGTLSLPALDLQLPVYASYNDDLMKDTVCSYSGSVAGDDLVIAGHNYKRHFGGLVNLQPGDEVTLKTLDGKEHTYRVELLETLDSTAVEDMTSGEYALTLFTCNYSGQARIAVRCQKIP